MGLSLYKINKNYNKELSILDSKVVDVLDEKEKRPFVGMLIIIENFKYLAPFPHRDNGKLGVINFNKWFQLKISI